MKRDDLVIIQKSIDKGIAEEFERLLGENKNDKLLQLLIELNKQNIEINKVELEEIVKKVE